MRCLDIAMILQAGRSYEELNDFQPSMLGIKLSTKANPPPAAARDSAVWPLSAVSGHVHGPFERSLAEPPQRIVSSMNRYVRHRCGHHLPAFKSGARITRTILLQRTTQQQASQRADSSSGNLFELETEGGILSPTNNCLGVYWGLLIGPNMNSYREYSEGR